MKKNIFKVIRKIKLFFNSTYQIIIRKKMDYFDYNKICQPFDMFYYNSYPPNKYYGINIAVSRKLKSKLPQHAIIEHGVYFGDNINKEELCLYKKPIIYTMGKQRCEFLKKNGFKNVYSLGPFIKFAKNFKSPKELDLLKSKFGKTLLVFPSHSIEGVNSSFNEKIFLNEIIKCSNDYDTTLICMYWKDVLDNRHVIYENAGFTIVSAGYRNDSYFLSRLKDLIELSDMTMSNCLGTHIGYSISLNKPHYLFRQEHSYTGINVEKENMGKDMSVMEIRKNLFYKKFGLYKKEISKEQIELVKYYWGDF